MLNRHSSSAGVNDDNLARGAATRSAPRKLSAATLLEHTETSPP